VGVCLVMKYLCEQVCPVGFSHSTWGTSLEVIGCPVGFNHSTWGTYLEVIGCPVGFSHSTWGISLEVIGCPGESNDMEIEGQLEAVSVLTEGCLF
jgi:hypothetical protein